MTVDLRRHFPWFIVVALVLAMAVLFASGRIVFNSTNADKKQAEEKEESVSERVNRNVVRLDPNEASLAGLKVEPAQEHDLPSIITLPGEVQVAEDRLARVTSSVAGVVRSVAKAAGDRVEKGGVLCTVESPELGDTRGSYVEALSERDFAQRNYDRWKLLYEKGLRTQNELYAAESDLTKARIKTESAEAKLRALDAGAQELEDLRQRRADAVNNRSQIVSPVRGFVLDRTVTPGQSIDTREQLFQVADLSTVWVVAAAQESDLRAARSGLAATVEVPERSGAPIKGLVISVGPQADEKTRTVQLRVAVNNPAPSGAPLLRPGVFTSVSIETGTKGRALAIPKSAILTEGPDSFVFVLLPESSKQGHASVAFERRAVNLGTTFGDIVEIRQGIKPGDGVVTKNAYMLKAEMQKTEPED